MANESQQNINSESDEISLKQLILVIIEWCRYLLSKWFIILLFCALGVLLGITYAYYKKPIYTATTTFVLEDEKSSGGLGSLAGLASMAGVDVGGGGGGIFQGENILELYKSRKMIEQTLLSKIQVCKGQLLVDRYIEFNKLDKKWVDNPRLMALNFFPDTLLDGKLALSANRLRDSIMGTIVSDISQNYLLVSKLDKKLSIIKVDVKAKDEIFAKAFNDQIVINVNDFYLQTKTKKSLQNVNIMQQKTDSVRAVMNGAIYRAVAVADATPNLNPTRQVQRVAPAQRAQFSAESNKDILSSLVQNLEMSKVTLMKETPLLEVIDKPVFPLYKEKFGTVKFGLIGGFSLGLMIVVFLLIKLYLKTLLSE